MSDVRGDSDRIRALYMSHFAGASLCYYTDKSIESLYALSSFISKKKILYATYTVRIQELNELTKR